MAFLRPIILVLFITICFNIENGNSAELSGIPGVRQCGRPSVGTFNGVFVTGCDSFPCKFKNTDVLDLFVLFTPRGNHNSLTYKMEASALGFNIPLPSGNVCDKLLSHQSCPFKDGKKYILSLNFDVASFKVPFKLPDVLVTVSIFDEDRNQQICLKIPAKGV